MKNPNLDQCCTRTYLVRWIQFEAESLMLCSYAVGMLLTPPATYQMSALLDDRNINISTAFISSSEDLPYQV